VAIHPWRRWPISLDNRSGLTSVGYYATAPNRRGHKAMMLSDVCLSRTPGLSREQTGLGRLKLTHVTRTPLSRSKGQRSRSPGRLTHRRVNASGSCSGERGNVLAVGNYCYVAVCSAARGASVQWRSQKYCVGAGSRASPSLPPLPPLFSLPLP